MVNVFKMDKTKLKNNEGTQIIMNIVVKNSKIITPELIEH